MTMSAPESPVVQDVRARRASTLAQEEEILRRRWFRVPYFSKLEEGEEDPHPGYILLFFLALVVLVELTGNGFTSRDRGGVGSFVVEVPHLDASLFTAAVFEPPPSPPALQLVAPVAVGSAPPPFQGAAGVGISKPSMAQPTFWFVWSTSLREWHWMPLAVVESVFKYHPRAHVTFLSLIMPLDFFDCFKAAGFDIEVKRYDLGELSQGTVIEAFVASGRLNESTYFRYAHESDLVRLVVLAKYGGIYVDTDVLLLRPFDAPVLDNPTLGVEYFKDTTAGSKTFGGLRLNNAFMGFPHPGNPFLDWVMTRVDASYNPKEWAAIGPDLITEGYKAQVEEVQDAFQLVPPRGLYPLHWARAHTVLNPDRTEVDKDWPVEVRNETYGIHLYNSNSWRYYVLEGPPKGSLIEDLVEAVKIKEAKCEHLRRPAWEYEIKVKNGRGRLKEHLKAKERGKGV